MNSVIEAHQTFLDNLPYQSMRERFFRMSNYYAYGPMSRTRDYDRERREDAKNAKLNMEWETTILDGQRQLFEVTYDTMGNTYFLKPWYVALGFPNPYL